MKLKIGIFFGGPSREREHSFTAGKMVYEHLDRSLFEPIPIFVDAQRQFILLDRSYLFHRHIRDFYPSPALAPPSAYGFQIHEESLGRLTLEESAAAAAQAGRLLRPEELPRHIDLAFLALYGLFGDDGQIQGILDHLGIPYTGNGAAAAPLLSNKVRQREFMAEAGFPVVRGMPVDREMWLNGDAAFLRQEAARAFGYPLVIRPAHQGAAIGLSIHREEAGLDAFVEAMNAAFFREIIPLAYWRDLGPYDKAEHLQLLTNPAEGLGFPLRVVFEEEQVLVYHPDQLLEYLNEKAEQAWDDNAVFVLESRREESEALVEPFIQGVEFSCTVLRLEDNGAAALPPTSVTPLDQDYLFRGKYAPGPVRLDTPARLDPESVEAIRGMCEALFQAMGLTVMARIDGFLTPEGRVMLSDVNGNAPLGATAFFFQQLASIGLAPGEALTYFIRVSLRERARERVGEANAQSLLEQLDENIDRRHAELPTRQKIAVVFGGGCDADAALESGRNLCRYFTAGAHYDPLPIFMAGGAGGQWELYHLPPHLLLEPAAQRLPERLDDLEETPALEAARNVFLDVALRYGHPLAVKKATRIRLENLRNWVDLVFIATLGQPGAQGRLQTALEELDIPFSGASARVVALTRDKQRTVQTLRRNGFVGPEQVAIDKGSFEENEAAAIADIESALAYPMVAKPADMHCPHANKIIDDSARLRAYARLLFRAPGSEVLEARYLLKLRPNEHFPRHDYLLCEQWITPAGAQRVCMINAAVLVDVDAEGAPLYQVLELSEILPDDAVLTGQERYLSGGGRYITPARLSSDVEENHLLSQRVKADIEKAARILNLEGYASFHAYLRIFPGGRVETIVTEVDALPAWTSGGPLPRQAIVGGHDLIELAERVAGAALRKLNVVKYVELPAAAAREAPTFIPLPVEAPPPIAQPSSSAPVAFPAAMRRPIANLGEFLREKAQQVWLFLSSAYFLKNLGALLLLLGLFFFAVVLMLRWYTSHGESLEVHNYVNMTLEEAKQKARSRSFRVVVSDSTFILGRQPNIVLEQDPKPFSRVKERRRIYLTVSSSTPPEVLLPDLEGTYNYDQYSRKLLRLGLQPIIRERQFSSKLEENTILFFYHKGQKISETDLKRGVKIPKGSVLEFVVTERLSSNVLVPTLVCKRFSAAQFLVESHRLVIGEIIGNVPNRANAYVYRQEPEPGAYLRVGEPVNLYLRASRPSDCPDEVEDEEDFLNIDPAERDTTSQ